MGHSECLESDYVHFRVEKKTFFFKHRYFVNNIVIDIAVNMEHLLKNKRLILFLLTYLRELLTELRTF